MLGMPGLSLQKGRDEPREINSFNSLFISLSFVIPQPRSFASSGTPANAEERGEGNRPNVKAKEDDNSLELTWLSPPFLCISFTALSSLGCRFASRPAQCNQAAA